MKRKITIRIAVLLLALVTCQKASAGDRYLSVGVGRDISGSGLGGNVCPGLSFTLKRNTFEAGINFQRERMNFSGYQLTYRYAAATSPNEKFQLYFSGNFTYHFSAYLSSANAEIEHACRKEQPDVYHDMRLKVLEAHAAIGLKYYPVRSISLGFSVGIGMFNTLNEDYDREMYRDKAAPSLRLRIMAGYNFGR